MKKAFTLVELLVVISIVSMLASVVLVNIATVRAQGRDSLRTQQIRQIDLAIKLYKDMNGYAPYWTGCDIVSENPEQNPGSACFAVSTSGVDGHDNWDEFIDLIRPYMETVPNDPCTTCASPSGFPMGYAYVTPRAVQYYCAVSGTCSANRGSYQTYVPLERSPNPSGYRDVGDFFTPTEDFPVIRSFMVNRYRDDNGAVHTDFSMEVDYADSCTMTGYPTRIPPTIVPISSVGHRGQHSFIGPDEGPDDYYFGEGDSVVLTCVTVGGTATGQLIIPGL